ncbi:MAG: ABC transporter permease [Chloroflexi bacterium]|nr:ABC transporter permease [Chloroflexota bacterium]
MQKYIANRLLAMIVSLFGVTIIVFLFIRLIPGTIVEQMLGTEALTSYETVESLRRYFGLDQPVYVQYYQWITRVLVGDLGNSWRTAIPVLQFIFSRLPVTIELTGIAIIVALLIGVPAGIVSALKQNSMGDNLARLVALTGLSIPVFWQGTMFILVLSLAFRWAPAIEWVPPTKNLVANLNMMLLPGFCLGTASAAVIMRMTRSCMLEVLRQEYIRTARAKGLAEQVVIIAHALKNAMIPVVTVAGLQMGYLLGGTVVVEEVFTLPGIGRLLLWAIYQRDYPTVQGTVLFVAVMFMAVNLLVDVLYAFLDPRIRYA